MAPTIMEVPEDHERYKSGQLIEEPESRQCSKKQVTYGCGFSHIAVPTEMNAQSPMS